MTDAPLEAEDGEAEDGEEGPSLPVLMLERPPPRSGADPRSGPEAVLASRCRRPPSYERRPAAPSAARSAAAGGAAGRISPSRLLETVDAALTAPELLLRSASTRASGAAVVDVAAAPLPPVAAEVMSGALAISSGEIAPLQYGPLPVGLVGELAPASAGHDC